MADSFNKIQAKPSFIQKRSTEILQYPVYFAVLLLVWISTLNFPARVAGVSLDESWQRSFAYFLKHRLQAGTDFVFTYGPLGYFSTSIYDRDLFWPAYFFQIALCLLLTFFLARVIRIERAPARNFISLLLITLFFGALHRDAQFLFLIVLVGINLLDESSSMTVRVLALLILCVLSLGKFVLFGFSVLIVLCSEVLSRLKNSRLILSPAILFTAIFLLLYLLLGQSLTAFPQFLYSSIQISSGYNEAMSIEGDPNEIFLSLGILFLLVSILFDIYRRQKKEIVPIGKLLIIGMALILSWKQGFIRQDNHTVIFFGYSLFAILILVLQFDYGSSSFRRPLQLIAVLCVLGGSIHGFFESAWSRLQKTTDTKSLIQNYQRRINSNYYTLMFPMKARGPMERKERDLSKQWELPLFANQIQAATVDILSYQQGILLLNRMSWLPRPVFQGYSAYTAYLAQRNAEFFRFKSSPDYLIFRLQSIDNRYPTLDDNLSLFEIAARYQPVAVERSLLLLKKVSNRPASISIQSETKQTIPFNQEMTAVQKFPYQILFVDIQDTFLGKLRKILFRPPHIYMKVKTSTGDFSYRMIAGPAREGFLLSPLLRNTDDFCLLFGPGNGATVQNFHFETDSPGIWFQNSIRIVLQGANHLANRNMNADQLAMIRDSLWAGTDFSGTAHAIRLKLSGGHHIQSDGIQALYENGKMFTVPRSLPAGDHKLVIIGYGTKAGTEFSAIHLSLNDRVLRTFSLNENRKYEFPVKILERQACHFTLEFFNDANVGKEDRNVLIKSIYILPGETLPILNK